MIKREEVYIRDPYIVSVEEEGKYYMFGTTDRNCWRDQLATGFDYYTTHDFEHFEGPFPAFRPGEDFWADRNFWAPEVHTFQGKYYIFATFITDGMNRGTSILSADNITGPYSPHSDGAVTPEDWMCLDGTFYLDDNGDPWMIFCHEWVQIYDGEICALRLSDDLKDSIGEPVILFRASDAPWSRSIRVVDNKKCYVTDGPYIYTTEENKLLMIWSSFVENNTYAIGTAISTSGDILGPWTHENEPIFAADAGHGMVFQTFEDQLMMTIHTPNIIGEERPIFIEIEEKDDRLIII